MHPSEPPQTLGRPRERGGRGKNRVNWQSSGQSGASERDMCGSVDLMVLGGATPREVVTCLMLVPPLAWWCAWAC